jgi:hypothetical protein
VPAGNDAGAMVTTGQVTVSVAAVEVTAPPHVPVTITSYCAASLAVAAAIVKLLAVASLMAAPFLRH